jgi:peptidyl-prolyl cis-trans isomerase D
MSIIQKIRDKAAIVLTTMISISLIAFLVQDAFVGGNNSLFDGQPSSVGSINGKDVDLVEFSKQVNLVEQNYRSQGMQTDEMMTQSIIENVWNTYIQKDLVKSEAGKLGITITPKELGAVLFSDDAPQEFKQLFQNQNTGGFDVAAAKNWFNNVKKGKPEDVASVNDQLLNPIEINLLTQKYTSLFSQGSYVPKWMLEKMASDNNAIASISFVSVPYGTIADSTVKVSDKEISDYVAAHKDEFKQDQVKSIAYVSLSATPTQTDSAKLSNQLLSLKSEFLSAADAKSFVTRNNTVLPYFDGYALKSRLQMSAKDSIISMPVGSVIGPYLDGGSMVIAKKIETKTLPDSTKSRHILIGVVDPRTGQQRRSDSAAKKTADSIYMAIKAGADFGTLASTLSDDQGSKASGGEYNLSSIDMGTFDKDFVDFVFYKPKGSMAVVKTSFGYHVIEVLNQKNFEDGYKVAYLSKPIVASEETDITASTAATQFASASKDLKSFEATLAKMKLSKNTADNIKPLDYTAGNLSSRSLIRWVFDNKIGTVSEPFDLKDQYVVAVVTNEIPEGVQPASVARVLVEPILRNKKKAEAIAKKIAGEKDFTKIATQNAGITANIDTVRFNDPFLPGLGAESKVIGAAFNKKNLSTISEVIEGQNGAFFIKVNQVGAVPSASVDINGQKRAIEQQMKQFAVYSTMESLKKSTKIVDKRREAGY